MATPDFVQDLVDLRTELAELCGEPVKKPLTRAIHDGWRAILRPRFGEFSGDIGDLVRSEYWEWKLEDGDEKAHRVRAKMWLDMRLDLGSLYVALYGALQQYLGIRITWQENIRFGIMKSPTSSAQIGSDADFAKRKKEQLDAAAALQTQYKDALKTIVADFEAKQKGLLAAMVSLRKIAAGMAKGEEDRIVAAIAGLQATGAEKTELDAKVRKMQDARRNFESWSGFPGADFGNHMDRWMQARRPLLADAPA
jgi:hypothetical protein